MTTPKEKPTGRHTPPKGAKNLEDAASKALLAGDSGTAPPPEGVIQLAEIFSLALASLRRPLEVAASRFEDLQRGVPKNSPVCVPRVIRRTATRSPSPKASQTS